MAFKKLQAAKSTLQNPDVGQRVKDEGKRAFAEWKAQHEQALDVIQELYITYYSQTMDVYKGLSPVQGRGGRWRVVDKQALCITCFSQTMVGRRFVSSSGQVEGSDKWVLGIIYFSQTVKVYKGMSPVL